MFAETDVTLRVSNGKIVRPKGRCTLKLDLNGLQESFEFVVMEDCSHEVILGWDFLKLSRAIIDSADDTLFLEKCLFEDTSKNSSPLYSELEYRIEPASIQLIEVARRDIPNDAIVVAECRKELLLERELTAPSSVISLTNNRGYWQIDVEESDREKTAFITPDGLYEFKVMPFGLCNALATFERMIDNLLKGLKWTICLCYLDDIIVFSDGFEEHLRRLQLVLNCLKKAGLCLNSNKCKFGAKTITVLGHEVSENGIRPDQEKIRAVRDFATPRSLKEVRSFLGLSSYYRRFIPNYAHVAQPLNDLLKKDSAFNWNQEEQNAFEALKSALISEPALGHFDYSSPTEIHTDASNYGIGALLVQIQKGKERAIAYASRTLNKAEKIIQPQKGNALPSFGLSINSDHMSLDSRHLQPIPVPEVAFEKVGMDLLGRFPTSEGGNRWIIVCTDYLTKYAITKALPTSESMEVAKFFIEDVILKHGAPRELITDRGRNFTSSMISDLNNQCRITHRKTTAYHPQTNGLTERLNKTIADMLSMYVDVYQKDWDRILPFVTFAYNTAKQESTGFTPFFLVHGREAETPLDVLFPKLLPEDDDFIQTLGARAEEARKLARIHSMRSQDSNRLPPEGHNKEPTMLKSEPGETSAQVPSTYISLQQPRYPSTFVGDGSEDAQRWLKDYQRVAKFNRWDDSMCLANVIFFLAGTARQWYENNEDLLTSWEVFQRALGETFGEQEEEMKKAEIILKTRAQKSSESSESYIQDVLYLCQLANPLMDDETKLGHLMKGIAEDIYQLLIAKDVEKVNQFLKECRKIELMKKRRITVRKFERLPNVALVAYEEEDLPSMIRRIVQEEFQKVKIPSTACFLGVEQKAESAPLEDLIKREIKRELAPITGKSSFSRPQRRKLRGAAYTGGKAADVSEIPPPLITANMKRNFVLISVNRQNIEALVDSGADFSVISENFRRHLRIPFFVKKGPILRVANKKYVETLGRCNIRITIKELEVRFNFVVLSECSHHIILGWDFFQATNAIIDWGTGEMHLEECASQGIEDEDLAVYACEDCIIPGRSISKIAVISEKVQGAKDLIVEGHKDLLLKKELAIPSSVINFHHGRGDVWVTNATSRNQIIPAGMLVGNLGKIGSSGIFSIDMDDCKEIRTNIKNEDIRQNILSLVDDTLSKEQRSNMAECLINYAEIFDFERRASRPFFGVKHKIDTSDNRPIKQRPYRVSPTERRAIQGEVDKMIKMGVAQPSESPWSSPVVLVKKKDGSWRFCVDYRRLNRITKKDVYPIPRTDDVLDSLTGAKFYSSMDLRTGYWQIEIDEGDREKTAFVTPDGLYEFRVMPFGLCNAPATFERMMDNLLAGLKWTICLCYLDDIIVYASSFQEHMERLEKTLKCIQRAEEGIRPDPGKIEAIINFPTPKNTTDVRSFIGLCSYYRRFVRNFANKAKPLHELLKNNTRFVWSKEQDESFQIFKAALTTDPLLGHYIEEAETHLHTDASGHGIGAILIQIHEGEEKPIAYASRTLNAAEKNYSTTEIECLAVVWAIYKFRPYLFGRHFTVVSDHHSLVGIDLLGRFPVSNNGNKWIVVATDYLSRYAITRAIPNGSAEEVAKFMVEDILLKHGAPRELISDRGRTFISRTLKEINDLCGTIHRFTSAYHPQTNGLTERLNKTLADMLSMYVDVEQRNWDAVLPYVTFAYNTSQQESTGFSPFYLIHGRDVETPLYTILAYRENTSLEDYVESMVTNAEDARQLARLNILRSQERDKSRYDQSHRPVHYQTGDLVWVFTPKLLKRYFGPYRVNRQLSEVTYEVEPLEKRPRQRKTKDIVHRRSKTSNPNSKPWFDRECYLTKKNTKSHLKIYMKSKKETDRVNYISKKKFYAALIRDKKKKYYQSLHVNLSSNTHDSKNFWKTISIYIKKEVSFKETYRFKNGTNFTTNYSHLKHQQNISFLC
ncbi:hypothetical protein LAZ67_2003650 [Cordylochernes scorpioides]|uniref:Endonuclease n=1 Tax=Cordylochernes scorpioides TaxID=51811 RepID=A0ABY6K331_9ARAC|nr:hypothetical protein LAZ67_2003650 [Cordylochernes scorpioides]